MFLEKMCVCACGRKNWGVGACAAHYENVCDVRAGVDENPRTLKDECRYINMTTVIFG